MRNKIVLFVAGCCVLLLSSCLNSDENTITEIAPNCQISSFTLATDSVKMLEKVKFSIDQLNGRIFNADSLPYGTEIEKVVCTLKYMNSYAIGGIQVQQEAISDTLAWWNGTDSLDFSKPVKFKIYAYDAVTTKEYYAQVNIHQVVPDSMAWSLYADGVWNEALREQKVLVYTTSGQQAYYYMYAEPAAGKGYKLYRSPVNDVRAWTELSLTGLPDEQVRISQLTAYDDRFYVPTTDGKLYDSADGQAWSRIEEAPAVKYLLGNVAASEKQPAVLCGISEGADGLRFAAMGEDQKWTSGDAVPAGFPLTGFGASEYSVMYHAYLMVVAGRDKDNRLVNSSWGTMNGTNWALLSDVEQQPFDNREGVMVTPYDDRLFLIGGLDASGKALKDIYTSTDYGVTWVLSDSLVVMPADYTARGFASVQVDKEQFMFFFGGKIAPGANELNQIWRGRINRLGFKQ